VVGSPNEIALAWVRAFGQGRTGREPDGFDREETVTLLRAVARHDRAVGVQVTIYNPDADPDGSAGRALAGAIGTALKTTSGQRRDQPGGDGHG
jgi:arginase family enzyme